jgi:excisionase family DNA binding protein
MPDEFARLNGESRPAADSRKGTSSPPGQSLAPTDASVLKPLLRARDVAELLNVSAATVLDWWERAKLPGFKINGAVRFDRAEIEEWLAAQHREATR